MTRILALALALAAGPLGCGHRDDRASSRPAASVELRLELPAALEPERPEYLRQIGLALDQVRAWFGEHGRPVEASELIDRAVVFLDRTEARRRIAAHFGIPEDQVPPDFSGTVGGTRLFVVSQETYRETYTRLYPEYPWDAGSYRGLVTHEVAHRAHARTAIELHGTEDGMGPRWFFEGLAIACAGQFAEAGAAMPWAELEALAEKDRTESLSYPIYGRMFRSLAARFRLSYLLEQAGKADFMQQLKRAQGERGAPAP